MEPDMTHFMPAEAFPPGEFLRDELEGRGWSQADFAKIIGRPARLVSDVVNNKRGVSPETAMDFAAALGTSAQSWLNLDSSYQLFKASLEERSSRDELIARKAKLHSKYPISELLKNNWIENSESYDVLEGRVLSFYSIDSLDEEPDLQAAAKRNYKSAVSDSQLSWLYRVKNIAESIDTPKYSEKKLRAVIDDLEKLTLSAEEIRHVPSLLAQCGVKLVVVEPSKGSKICGVCFWVNDNKSPVIGMTLLLDRIDNFWFVLRHEIEHVLRKDGMQNAVIDEKNEIGELVSGATVEAEDAANLAAQEFCVPAELMTEYIVRVNPVFTEKSVLGFARRIQRHPGIVVGQLQYRTGKWGMMRNQLVKIRHIITQTALTDGYGVNTSGI